MNKRPTENQKLKTLVVILILLMIVFKDQVKALFCACPCDIEDQPENNTETENFPSTPNFNPHASVMKVVDVEDAERSTETNVLSESNFNLERQYFKPTGMLTLVKEEDGN